MTLKPMHFRNIAILRHEFGLSQAQLGELIGEPQSKVARWEAGCTIPKTAQLIKVADVFDVSLEYLCGRKDVEKRRPTIEEKLLEFRALDLGLPEAKDVDPLTREIWDMYKGKPEELARQNRGMMALINSGKTKAEMSLSEIVSTVLAA